MPCSRRAVSAATSGLFFTGDGGSHPMPLNFGIQRPDAIDECFERMGDTWRALAVEVGGCGGGVVF